MQGRSSVKHDRHAPSEGAQRAGAAALARIEQHQKPKVHTSQDAIRTQGETCSPVITPGGVSDQTQMNVSLLVSVVGIRIIQLWVLKHVWTVKHSTDYYS